MSGSKRNAQIFRRKTRFFFSQLHINTRFSIFYFLFMSMSKHISTEYSRDKFNKFKLLYIYIYILYILPTSSIRGFTLFARLCIIVRRNSIKLRKDYNNMGEVAPPTRRILMKSNKISSSASRTAKYCYLCNIFCIFFYNNTIIILYNTYAGGGFKSFSSNRRI